MSAYRIKRDDLYPRQILES